ncbi:hypothetical protein U0070_008652, partial [Myodes glareolus]
DWLMQLVVPGQHAMGNCCWVQCFGLHCQERGLMQTGGGGTESKCFRACPRALRYNADRGQTLISVDKRERTFVRTKMGNSGNSECCGFMNPILELLNSSIRQSETDQQLSR